jgi:RNA-dependent RNA polymerase
MDYTAPPPVISDGPVTVDAISSFFVTHMKNDTLGRIATAHRYWADRQDDGVKDNMCLQLAALHSMAVDYAKTGVPAEMPKDMRIPKVPHWAEKGPGRSYTSKKILGQLYDEVDRVPFDPAWELPFDSRIIEAYGKIDQAILDSVKEIKRLYDEGMRNLMSQHGIRTEFEVWTAFVLAHNHENRDYKLHEELGEAAAALKRQFQDMCYEGAGTTPRERDWDKLKLWVAGMYIVTAQEVAAANAECDAKIVVGGEWVPQRFRDTETMPLISFPWLFQRELGMIAKKKDDAFSVLTTAPTLHLAGKQKTKTITKFEESGAVLEPLLILPSTISSDPESEELKSTTPPLRTGLLTPDSEQERKDSCIIDRSTSEPTSPTAPACKDDNSSRQDSIPTEEPATSSSPSTSTNDAAVLRDREIRTACKVLAESSAFDISDADAVARGLAEIDAMPAESEGEYQTTVPEVVPEVLPVQLLLKDTPKDVEDTPSVDVDDDSDDEMASEGQQVSCQLEKSS